MEPEAALVAEANRIYERYAVEVIEAHGFCPWAADARRNGQVVVAVVLGAAAPLDGCVAQAMAMARRASIDIGLLVLPQFAGDALTFQHFAAGVRTGLSDRFPQGDCPWAIADFHPRGPEDLSSPERAVAFIRRSPDPTLQLVRKSVLAQLRRNEGEGTSFLDVSKLDLSALQASPKAAPLHERVAQGNHRKLARVSDQVRASLEAIRQDRNTSYAAIAVQTPRW